MPTEFPNQLDVFENPTASDKLDSVVVPHSEQHANANDAIEALQAKIGIEGSTDPDSLDYKIAHKVDQEAGKGLSENDYTDTEKAKLAGIAESANAYTHPDNHPPSIIAQDASNRFVSDAEKSAWNAKQAALGFTAEDSSQKGAASGYAPLGSDSKIPSTYLPSYVDDVVEGASLAAFPGTGETSKIYVALDSNKAYRWSGSSYVEISGSPGSTDAVTEGSTNLYFTVARVRAAVLTGLSLATNAAISATDTVLSALGKLQKQITDLAAANTGDETTATIKTKLGITTLSGSNTGDQTKTSLGLGNVDNTSDANKPVSSAAQTALNLKANLASPSFTGNVLVNDASGGLGYGSTSRGSVTQTTDKGTPVTLNRPCGTITMSDAPLLGNAPVVFILYNSTIAATDKVSFDICGTGSYSAYIAGTSDIQTGLAVCFLRNLTSGSLLEAVRLRYNVIKG